MTQLEHRINSDQGKHTIGEDISGIVRDISYLYRDDKRISKEGKLIIHDMLADRFEFNNQAIESMLDKCESDMGMKAQALVGNDDNYDKRRALHDVMMAERIKIKSTYSFYDYNDMWREVDSTFLTKRGKFPKRLASYIKKALGIKVDKPLQELISVCGEVARANVSTPEKIWYDITPFIDWDAGDFGDSGSCYWGDYAGAKEMQQNAGGGALRIYNKPSTKQFADNLRGLSRPQGKARVWIMPILHNDTRYYALFNAYGSGFNLIKATRILATILGLSYKKVQLYNNGSNDGIYINGHKGYLLGHSKDIETIESRCTIDFQLDAIYDEGYSCDNCGDNMHEDNSIYVENWGDYCEYCHSDMFTYCNWGEHEFRSNETYYQLQPHIGNICGECVINSSDIAICENCGNADDLDHSMHASDTDNMFCRECSPNNIEQCESCSNYVENYEEHENCYYCENCIDDAVLESQESAKQLELELESENVNE